MASVLRHGPAKPPARRRFPAWAWAVLAILLFGGVGGVAWAIMSRGTPIGPAVITTFAPANPADPTPPENGESAAGAGSEAETLLAAQTDSTDTPTATLSPTDTPTSRATATMTATPEPTATRTPDPLAAQGRIVFVSDRGSDDSIFILDVENPQNPRRLTTTPGYDWWPEWCGPNSIVFERADDLLAPTWQEIMHMDADGNGLRQLTSNTMPLGSAKNGSPSCSPGGDRLAFSSHAEGTPSNDFKIGLTNLDDTALNFAQFGDGYSLGGNVSWSPQQDAITFMHRESSFFEIYRAPLAAPTTFINLTSDFPGNGKYPAWSPTANQIAFACSAIVEGAQAWALCLTPADRADVDIVLPGLHPGSEFEQKGDWPRHAVTPSWSPNGRWITFSSDIDGDWDIYIYSLDTGETINLTSAWPSDEMHPSWGP